MLIIIDAGLNMFKLPGEPDTFRKNWRAILRNFKRQSARRGWIFAADPRVWITQDGYTTNPGDTVIFPMPIVKTRQRFTAQLLGYIVAQERRLRINLVILAPNILFVEDRARYSMDVYLTVLAPSGSSWMPRRRSNDF